MEAGQREKAEKLAVVGLVGVLIVVLGSSVKNLGVFGHRPQPVQRPMEMPKQALTVPEPFPQPTAAPGPLPDEGAGSVVFEGGQIRMPTIDYVADLTRDPLRPVFQQEPAESVERRPDMVAAAEIALGAPFPPGQALGLPPIAIQGLIWGGASPRAIIDGQIYEIGDAIDGARIVAIDREGLTVTLRGATFRRSLKSESRPEDGSGWTMEDGQ